METLIVAPNLSFQSLIRVAEGMSYKQDVFCISARGKQIQRGAEIVALLFERRRIREAKHNYGHIHMGDKKITVLRWTLMSS